MLPEGIITITKKGGQGSSRKKELFGKKNELINSLKHLRAQKDTLKNQRNIIKLPLQRKKDQSIEDYINANVAEYNSQISQIEKEIQFEHHSLYEEKRKISELEKVRKSKGLVDEYRRNAEEIQQINNLIKVKGDELTVIKTELDEILNAEKAQNEEFEKNKKSSEEKQEHYQSLHDQKITFFFYQSIKRSNCRKKGRNQS